MYSLVSNSILQVTGFIAMLWGLNLILKKCTINISRKTSVKEPLESLEFVGSASTHPPTLNCHPGAAASLRPQAKPLLLQALESAEAVTSQGGL